MAVGPRDQIDELLVKKYANEKVDNHDTSASLVDVDKMYEAMNDYANVHKTMLALQARLNYACAGIVAKNAKYRRSPQSQIGATA